MTRRRLVIVGGGQSGLATARAGHDRGWDPVVLEAGPHTAGSWPSYYDSLTLFSPRRYSAFPDFPFPGALDGYPKRDEVVAYLTAYARWLGVDVRTRARVVAVEADPACERGRPPFTASLADGPSVTGDALVAATGSFGRPFIPEIPGRSDFRGQSLTVADYQSPLPFTGQRVVVVGSGNSAVQVGYELADVAQVTLAVRDRVRIIPQRIAGRSLHWWLRYSRADLLPPSVLRRVIRGNPVIDDGTYRDGLRSGRPQQRRMFTRFTPAGVRWTDGTEEAVDSVIFATGYLPHLPYLAGTGALDSCGIPRHRRGLSTTHAGLAYLGLDLQRSYSSNTLRGVHRDADYIVRALGRVSRQS